jgi:hypothetical protein
MEGDNTSLRFSFACYRSRCSRPVSADCDASYREWRVSGETTATSRGGRKFYRELAAQGAQVRVGMEASGQAGWFERLIAELQFELWIGAAATEPAITQTKDGSARTSPS